MKEQEIIDQMIRQKIMELVNSIGFTYYLPLDPEWEELVAGSCSAGVEDTSTS